MAIVKIKVTGAEQVWASPDGQRKLYKLEANYDGKPIDNVKTYSEVIATVGWEGEVETRQGKGEGEVLVRQHKEEQPGGYRSGGFKGKPGASEDMMKLAYAKDIAVALINVDKYESGLLNTIVTEVGAAAELFATPPEASVSTEEATKNIEVEDVDKVVDEILGGEVSEEETPWTEKEQNSLPT